MSLASTNNRADYTGNGSTSQFDYTFKITSSAHLKVTKRDLSGTETLLTLGTNYTVTGVGKESGGKVTLTAGNLPNGFHLTIRRVEPLTQEVDIRNRGDFYPEVHEDAFDHLVALAQQQQDAIDRSIKAPETVTPETFNADLPADLVGMPSRSFGTNATGDGFAIGPSFDTIETANESSILALAASDAAQNAAAQALASQSAAYFSEAEATVKASQAFSKAVEAAASAADAADSAAQALASELSATASALAAAAAGGTVTSASVVSANGLAGTVANATTTPAITLSTTVTGLLKGNGTAISAATAGTDYQAPLSNFIYIDPASDSVHPGWWILDNCTYNTSTNRFNRIDTSKTSFGVNLRANANLPYEAGTTGITFWRATAGANPIGQTYGATGAWENVFLMTEYRDLVVGGYGIELDGADSVPYCRVLNSSLAGKKFYGFLTNLFNDFSGVDDSSKPSWRFGVTSDDEFIVERAPSGGSSTFANVLKITNAGVVTGIGGASIGGGGGSGTVTSASVVSANGFAGTVATATTTPAITLTTTVTGLLKGNGTSVSAATAGTDYLTGNQTVTLSGDVSGSGSTAITAAIGANKVTNAMLGTVPTATFKGRTTASTGNVEDLTATQATALLNNMVGDSGSGGTKGLCPSPASGDSAAGKYLSAGGTWSIPAGAGGGVTTMAAVGSTPNTEGASISGTTLTLQPASSTLPGVVSTGVQSFAGKKTFVHDSSVTKASGNTVFNVNSGATTVQFFADSTFTYGGLLSNGSAIFGATGTGDVSLRANGTDHLLVTGTTGTVTASGLLKAGNLVDGYATTATAAGTTTLTVASKGMQYFTGTTTQTVVLPVASTLTLGLQFIISNNSTGIVTVQSSGLNTIKAMPAGSTLVVTCILTSGTGTASWNASYAGNMTGDSGSGGAAGFVPSPASGDAAAGKYLKADGTWATPAGGGGGTPGGATGNIQFNNAGAFGGTSSLHWDNTNGRLGIGTSSPSQAVQVGAPGAVATPAQLMFGAWSNTVGYPQMVGNWSSAGQWGIGAYSSGTDSILQIGNVGTGGGVWSGSQYLTLYVPSLAVDTATVPSGSASAIINGFARIGDANQPTSTIHSSGSFAANTYTNSSAFSLDQTDHTVTLTGSTARTVTNPAASTCSGRIYNIRNQATANLTLAVGYVDYKGNTVTVVPPGVSVTIQSNGTNWLLVNYSTGPLVETLTVQDAGTSIAAATYTIELYAQYAFTINELKIISGSGTCTAAVKIGSTNVTGLSAVSVSSTIATGTATAANVVAVGDKITLVTTSNSSLNNLQASLKITRTA